MKKLLSFILIFAALLSGRAQTNINVIYSFLNGLNQQQQVVQVSFTPLALGIYSNAFVVGDENYRVVSGARMTNQMLAGFGYRVKYFRQKNPDIITSIFTNWFGTNVSGTVYATDYVTISTNLGSGIYAYSQAQADARFALIGSGGSATNLTGAALVQVTNIATSLLPAGVVTNGKPLVVFGTNSGITFTANPTQNSIVVSNTGSGQDGYYINGFQMISGSRNYYFGNGNQMASSGGSLFWGNGTGFTSPSGYIFDQVGNIIFDSGTSNFYGSFVGNGSGLTNIAAATASTATNTPNGRSLNGLIGAVTNISFTPAGSLTGLVSIANNTLTMSVGASNPPVGVSTNGFLSSADGVVTNSQRMAFLGNTLLLDMPTRFFVYGDSLSVQLTTNGWLSYGGRTNSVSGGLTNGLVWYQSSLGGGPWAQNNVSLWAVLTNMLALQKIYSVELDTAAAVPGQLLGNIIGGYPAAGTTYQDQSYSGTYSASGTVTGLVGNAQVICWYPLSTNDLSITVTNHGAGTKTTYTTNYGSSVQISIGGAGQARASYSTVIFGGTVGSNCTSRVHVPYFQGQQLTAAPPWTGNGNASGGTNNLAPITWASTNAPNRTGTNAGAILFAGGNDFSSGVIGNFPSVPNIAITNQYLFAWSNVVAWCQTNRALGFYPIIVCIWPRNTASNAASTVNVSNFAAVVRANVLQYADILFDLDATNYNAGLSGTNYMDGTHATTLFAGQEATNAFNGMRFNRLLKSTSY